MPFADDLARIQEQIAAACRKAGRSPDDVALMAVSKMHSAEAVREACDAGVWLFGENRVQEWQQKREALADLFGPGGARVHLIGPLQSNKTARAAELFDAVDTVDSLKIASRLAAAAEALGRRLQVMIEVKLSHEESKHGIVPSELPALLQAMQGMEWLVPAGLMTVPPWSKEAEPARPYFRELRRLRDASLPLCPTLTDLSMGMSNDFTVAIEEGSTCVRIGTALFGRRQYAEPVPQQNMDSNGGQH
ncbi:MAG TPA: YggS family pyridoxal phosphate-dependent enzyme [Acidobacteriaceae bacterium]|nr:YggS family pyridoxal phosphate-dependent enzyme [Acidobacteriaceae bacterium]